MGIFGKKKTSEESKHEEIGKYLIDGEVINHEFGLLDKAYLTNKRLIFKDINLTLGDSTREEKVFLPISRIDSVAIKKSSKMIGGTEVIIRARGISHSMKLAKETEEVISFVNEVSKAII